MINARHDRLPSLAFHHCHDHPSISHQGVVHIANDNHIIRSILITHITLLHCLIASLRRSLLNNTFYHSQPLNVDYMWRHTHELRPTL
jgi:hypothetical protein